jgi:hypothetical protein
MTRLINSFTFNISDMIDSWSDVKHHIISVLKHLALRQSQFRVQVCLILHVLYIIIIDSIVLTNM